MARRNSASLLLLDTCAVSELQKPYPNLAVVRVIAAAPDDALFLSVLTVGEIKKGIDKLVPGKRKDQLIEWLVGILARYGDRILPVDVQIAGIWGQVSARAEAQGIAFPAIDGLIAATALRHGLAVVTRNGAHFEAAEVAIIDPWAD